MTGKFDYSEASLVESLRGGGIRAGDIVLLHLSMGRLGRLKEGSTLEVMSAAIVSAIRTVIGDNGTLLVPSYTYSLGKGEVYSASSTASTIGPFPEFYRKLEGVKRSREPMLATSGEGAMVDTLFHDLPGTCFGPGSLFDRLRESGAKICTLGIGLHWATFRHHIEEMCQVPFRHPKTFRGRILDGESITEEDWTYFAAPFLPNCQPNGAPLESLIKAERLSAHVPVGRSELIVIGAREYFDFSRRILAKNPWFTAVGPPCERSAMLAAMRKP